MSSRQTFTRGRRFAIAVNVLVASLLALSVGGVIVYLAFRPELRQRVDLTTDRTLTLEDKTLQVLESLPEGIEISTCFYASDLNPSGQYVPGLGAVVQRVAQHANDLLREYEFHSRGKIRAHFYSPVTAAHVTRIEELGAKIGRRPDNVVVVEYGNRRKVLGLKDLAEYDDGAQASQSMRRAFLEGFRDQQSFTTALLSVTEDKPIVVGFLQGHGERTPADSGLGASGSVGLARLAAALQADNFQLRMVNLSDQSLAPGAPDVLVISAPRHPPTDAELESIQRYVREGGRLFLFLEPDSPIDLDYPLLDQLLGLRRLPGMVNIPMETGVYTRRPFAFTEVRYGVNSVITKPLRDGNLTSYWQTACALETLGRPEHSHLHYEILAWTAKNAYLDLPTAEGASAAAKQYNETFDPAHEKIGEYRLGYSVSFPAERGGGRAVVIGDADLVGDVVLASPPPGNLALGLGSVNFLADREQLISLPIRKYDEVLVDLTESEYQRILIYVVFAIPALALLLAVAVFWSRRN